MVMEATNPLVENGSAVEDIIVCRDVHKWFGNFHVLRGVNMTVTRGERSSFSALPAPASPPSYAASTGWKSTSEATSSSTASR